MFLLSFGIFSACVILYTIVKNLSFIRNSPGSVKILSYIFYLVVILNHFFIAYYGVSSLTCGEPQLKNTLVNMLPWAVIFFGTVGILYLSPAWKMPFSNTLGYGILQLPFVNITRLFMKMLRKTSSNTTTQQIISNPSLMINTFTTENFDALFDEVKGTIFSAPGIGLKEDLRTLVKMKDDIGTAIWLLLAGALSTVLSHSGIMKAECNNSTRFMREKANATERQMDQYIREETKEKKKYIIQD